MTKKWIIENGGIKDTVSGMTFDSFMEIIIVLNGQSRKLRCLASENEQLKSIIDKLTLDNTKMKKVLNTTKKENEHIKNTIKEAYNNERTHIGKNVLKQLLETIQ